jgi:hypothetical protein
MEVFFRSVKENEVKAHIFSNLLTFSYRIAFRSNGSQIPHELGLPYSNALLGPVMTSAVTLLLRMF